MATVKVYSTPTCMYCNLLKDFLTEKGVEFEHVDVAADAEARDYIVEKSGQMGVPVTEIMKDGEEESVVIVGFDESAISEALELKA